MVTAPRGDAQPLGATQGGRSPTRTPTRPRSALFLGADDPGYGFVADGVPELSLSVWSGYRGQGVGRNLLRSALVGARRRALRRVSLSVEAGNPSVRLYLGRASDRSPTLLRARWSTTSRDPSRR